MIIWGALLIPILTAIVLYFFFKHKTVWWEFLIPTTSSFFFVLIMKLIIEYAQIQCKEYWGSFIAQVQYYEDWDEEVPCVHSYDCNCTTDEDGNRDCQTCYMHAYDVDYHPPYWQLITTTNETIRINESEYKKLRKLFRNEFFHDMRRDYHSNDGDMYFAVWSKDSIRAIPVTTVHYYENRIKAADQSVFHFQKVDTSDIKLYGLKEYPPITNDNQQEALIGVDNNNPDAVLAGKKLKYINGLLGQKKEVRLFVIVFPDQPIEAGMYQEWHWSGANMNEFVVCIGTDKNNRVKWCYPFSWTPSEKLKIDVRQYVMNQDTLNLTSLSGYLQNEIDKQFIRRDFKAEFDYLTVEPPDWAVMLAYIFTLLLNVGLSLWVITNEHEEHE